MLLVMDDAWSTVAIAPAPQLKLRPPPRLVAVFPEKEQLWMIMLPEVSV